MTDKKSNRLINESSPYLLQHAYNPVDWYPWGDDALEKAKKENKLLIISIGYSACHWCHVMEHESFEDSTVAKLMNDHFVSIKVDREERPDVDDIYMTACNLVSGRGGWPLNAFALPDGRPVWAGTYFPQDQWLGILEQFKKLNEEDQERLIESAEKITEGIASINSLEVVTADLSFDQNSLDKVADNFLKNIDFVDGGRTGEPKFPMPNNYEFLMKYHHLSKNEKALEAVTTTLDKMAMGGIFDHLAGGFARYSVDAYWLVPHFEKMLYDNGQMLSLYAKAYSLTGKDLYKQTVEKIDRFINNELSSNAGGIFSSLDADSEGEEGKFYIWSESEVDSLITDKSQAKLFKEYYDISKKGNWEHTNILNKRKEDADFKSKHNLSDSDFNALINGNEKLLLTHRETRIRPGLDDKILSSWNGLTIKGYTDAYMAFGNEAYKNKALEIAAFIKKEQLKADFRLDRNFKDGKSSINAFLDDYASVIDGFIALYQITFDESWLDLSSDMLNYVIEHFYNDETKMFDYTSKLDPPLAAKRTEYSDNVIPSANSMMARNLFAYGTLKYNPDYVSMAKQMLKNMTAQIETSQTPNFFSNWLQLYLDFVSPPYEIAIVGPDAELKRKELAKSYLSNGLLLGGESEGSMDLLKDKLQEGETYIYVCQNKVCKFPVQDIQKALELMD